LKESSDGDTSRFEEQQRRKHDVRNRFLPWALGGETDWRNAANDWVDGKIRSRSNTGDRLWAGKPCRHVTSDPGKLSLPSLPGIPWL